MKCLSFAALALCAATAAFAHSQSDKTMPADGTVLNAAPQEISLSFTDKLRLTKVEARHSSGTRQAITLDGHTEFSNAFTLPIEPMGAGAYDVEWRGLGIDGHAMQGSFRFEVE